MGLVQEVTAPELTEKVDEYDVAEEVFEDVALEDEEEMTSLETEELTPVSHEDQNQTEEHSEATSKEAQAIWMKAFKNYVGRQPLPEEFLIGKSSGYDVSTIHQFISDGKVAKAAKPAMAKGKKILIIAGVVAGVLALAGYGFGSYYYSRGQVAERYEAAAYGKFDSYASNHNTTPDGVSDIFLNGTDDTMYKDVTADIDKNTTGAKNRATDSITISDIDVTEVVQTGEKTFKVTFTAVYDFYYGYDSKFKSSGDIKDNISWPCNVEYVGDDDSDSSSSSSDYSDYRINGKAGESQNVSRENTVK